MIIKNKKSTQKDALNDSQSKHTHNTNTTNINDYLFNLKDNLPPENVLVSIQGKTLLTTKNCMVISGKPKSRKSAVAHAILGSAIKNDSVLGIECNINAENDEIVLIDTEQSKHDLKKSLDRMQRQTEFSVLPDYFKIYAVRQLNPERIKSVIDMICLNKKVRLIIIDGALDLIMNMNDIIEVKDTIDWIKQILTNCDVGLIFILHQSKSTNFTIGHLGSYFDRFSQTVIEVTKLENGNSEIKAQMMRSDDNFKPYEFYYNYNISNYSINWIETLEVTASNKDYSIEQHFDKISKIYTGTKEMQYKNLISKIIDEYKKSEYWAKKLTKYLFEKNILIKNGSGLIEIISSPF
jgi:hypothetical protein